MDTSKKSDQLLLDFKSFINKYYDWYEIDGNNHKIIEHIGLWAIRSPKFNGKEPGWHIDRGLLIYGNFGSGKDELFRMLNNYLNYLKSPYRFSSKIVWEYAKEFMAKEVGYKCFDGEGKGNRYYEELCLTDESTGYPTREVVQSYGNKILIGAEIIHATYNAFKFHGYQAHFSTNVDEETIKEIYGGRIHSRLREMCNFVRYNCKDRRVASEVPTIMKNKNQPIGPPQPAELSPEVEREGKEIIENGYRHFIETGELPFLASVLYTSMVAFGVQVCTEEEMRGFMEEVSSSYQGEPSLIRKTASERERNRDAYIWEAARKIALKVYYVKMKVNGANSIFGEVNVKFAIDSKQRHGEVDLNKAVS